jgi:addiction module RelE/StbE family toxin
MVELIWTEPALNDLDAIADYIALENPEAARSLVQRVFQHVEQLATHPESGSRPRELRGARYRQIVEPPCRIFYRYDGERVFVLYVMRGEMRLRASRLGKRDRQIRKA